MCGLADGVKRVLITADLTAVTFAPRFAPADSDCFIMETFLLEKSEFDALEYVALSFHFKSIQGHPNL